MNRGIYTSATGMVATQKQMDVISNNLANVSTNGFRRDAMAFASAMEQEMRSSGGLGEPLGTLSPGVETAGQYTIMEPGPIETTGNPTDIAIRDDKGMFAVETPQGTRYTRNGAMHVSQDRRLVTSDGLSVLDSNGSPINLPDGKVAIGEDGEVMVDGSSVATIGVFEGTFVKNGPNLYSSTNATAADAPSLATGALEGSNVSAVQTMVELIQLNRMFELSQRSIQQQDDLAQKLISSLTDR